MFARLNREGLLRTLESVTPGLAVRELIQQSSCLAFSKGKVFTFNDEVACVRSSPVDLEGAVKAKPLLDILSKLDEDEVEVGVDNGELLVRGKRRKLGVRLEEEVLLPIEDIDEPKEWISLPEDFIEACSIACSCASSEESQFVLTCVHISSGYLEACDRFQIARYPISMGVGDMLIRADSLKKICRFDLVEFSVTESWIHFKTKDDLVLSCRKWLDEYPGLDAFLDDSEADDFTLPGGMAEAVDKAEVFSSDNTYGNLLSVDIKKDSFVIEGRGPFGWYKELKKSAFSGDPIKFSISPKLLVELANKSSTCKVMTGKMVVDTGKFRYSTCTQNPEG